MSENQERIPIRYVVAAGAEASVSIDTTIGRRSDQGDCFRIDFVENVVPYPDDWYVRENGRLTHVRNEDQQFEVLRVVRFRASFTTATLRYLHAYLGQLLADADGEKSDEPDEPPAP